MTCWFLRTSAKKLKENRKKSITDNWQIHSLGQTRLHQLISSPSSERKITYQRNQQLRSSVGLKTSRWSPITDFTTVYTFPMVCIAVRICVLWANIYTKLFSLNINQHICFKVYMCFLLALNYFYMLGESHLFDSHLLTLNRF